MQPATILAPNGGALYRDLRLDACRGIALWFIFLDHVPNNIMSWLTLRNYGFSDATEVFVFISGYTCMLTYGAALQRQGWLVTTVRALRRSWQIYVGFLLLVLFYLALVQAVSGGLYADHTNTRVFFDAPGATLLRVVTMQYTPVNTDILPTFVLFHLMFPALLWLLRRAATLTLAGSILVYGLVQAYGLNLSAWPNGKLFFNPLAWQLLFVFGAWYAQHGADRLKAVLRSPAVLTAAIIYLLFSLVVVLSWQVDAAGQFVPEALSDLLYPIDKSNLAPPRLMHFLALGVVAFHVVTRRWHGLFTPPIIASIRCGENSLPIYCISVLLSFLGHILLTNISSSIPMQIVVSLTGVAMMIGAATLITRATAIRGRGPKLF